MDSKRLTSPGHHRTFVLMIIATSTLSACATQPSPPGGDLPGFWLGLFHGFTILFSLVGSIFTEHRIYAFPNAGGWYDFGFFLGASMFLSGSGAGAKTKK